MNLLYIAQFHETCGYSHAALGYLKSLSESFKTSEINFKVLSVTLDPRNLSPDVYSKKISQEILSLVDNHHIKNQEELDDFISQEYYCIWHMTSVMPIIEKRPNIGKYYNDLNCSLENLILGSRENYHILAWETSKLPKEYSEVIKNYNTKKVFAPSKWNQKVFSEEGFDSVFLPHLIEENNITPTPVAIPDHKDKFTIFSVSEWTNRKNFQCLIRSYLVEFAGQEDTMLILKTSLPAGMDKQGFINQFNQIKESVRTSGKTKPNIVVILDYLDSKKMQYLYQSCDVFCLTSLGEGFSLPTSEAAILKKPIICPRVGGHIDYLSKDNEYFVDGVWDTVFDNPPYDNDGLWYVPTTDSTRQNMRKAYTDWKTGDILKSGKANYEQANSRTFSKEGIAEVFLNELRPGPPQKSKIRDLKCAIRNKTLKDQMSHLKDKYLGEECYILNCGPSLLDVDKEALTNFLSDKLTFTVKQAYDEFSKVSDFHFFNCSNLPKRPFGIEPYYKNKKDTIFVASSNYEQYSRWSLMQSSDVFFKIPIRTEINNEFLVRTSKIDENLIKNKLTRPCGPGIMYETVLFMAIHLGVKKINCIGWDLTNKTVKEDNYKHFYGTTEGLLNRGDILSWEIEETRKFSEVFYNWCLDNDIDLCLVSDKSSLSDKIPRIKLEL